MSRAHFTPFEADLDRETALSVLREDRVIKDGAAGQEGAVLKARVE